jgi:hypothetical protein
MWIKYTAFVSFTTLLIGYFAALFVGWSLAEVVPWASPERQQSILAVSAAIAILFLPTWYIHWRWLRQDWSWENQGTQNYLQFFTARGLGASGIIGVQLIARLLNIAMGSSSFAGSQQFLFGAIWSVAWSLWLWIYHGRIWLAHRRHPVDRSDRSIGGL